ncbi:hypothetical protein [Bradyrhizobium sp. Cp5.3]|uniref:hypothetical protein n=1 Tax=Bradyrhizobium sp. Cp5.3 TaxID=443598 RepID=UPI000550D90C|nr:hypothetical protein [Bradyrhizobium sp. Cp5.3]
MADLLLNALINALFAVVEFVIKVVLDLLISIDRTKRLTQAATGSDEIIDVPPDPKPLPPAAQRALAEAEERESARQSSQDHAASGTVQAS